MRLQSPVEKEPPQSRLLKSIDRYLRAAGATEPDLRGRLLTATARDLLAQGALADLNWAEIIAAIDRSLAAELAADGGALPRARGRVALSFGADSAIHGLDWGTPPRLATAMPAQDLSLWRPSADWLLRLHLSRPAQGLTACLCWLAVFFVP